MAVFDSIRVDSRCRVLGLGRVPIELPLEQWYGDADRADRVLLSHCHGTTLDVGCGPGRMTAALQRHDFNALGIDVSPHAVAATRARGGAAILGDVFEPVPAEGLWDTALLADGNIGIGGDPVRLLARLRDILQPRGQVVLDIEAPLTPTRTCELRLEIDGRVSRAFDWAFVGVDGLQTLAGRAGFELGRVGVIDRRWFAQLQRS